MSPRSSLDQRSFERVLSAASFMQLLDQQELPAVSPFSDSASGLLAMAETQQAIETGKLDLESATDCVVSLAVSLTAAQCSAMWLYADRELVYRTGSGALFEDEVLRLAIKSVLSSTVGLVDLSSLWNTKADNHFGVAIRSLLIAPVYHGDRVVGGLAVFSSEAGQFSQQDRTNLRLLSGVLAHALGKSSEAHLKQAAERERARVRQALAQLIPSLDRLGHLTHQTNELPPKALLSLAPQRKPVEGSHLPVSMTSLRGIAQRESVAPAVSPVPRLRVGVRRVAEPKLAAPATTITPQSLPISTLESSAPETPLLPDAAQKFRRACEQCITDTRVLLRRSAREAAAWLSAMSQRVSREYQDTMPRLSLLLQRGAQQARRMKDYKVRVRILAVPKGFYPLGIAGAGTSLVVLAFLMVMTSGVTRGSGAQASFSDLLNDGASAAIPGAATATQSASVPAPVNQAAKPAEGGSHLQVTDRETESALLSLSRFEIASLRRRARFGDDSAAFLLGMAYETGKGVPRSCVKAVEWVLQSAAQGNPAAQYNLALRYRDGDGVAVNPAEANKWFKRAAARKYEATMASSMSASHAM
jgi:TPR repeat protein